MKRLVIATSSITLVLLSSCLSTTLDMTKLTRPVMLNSYPEKARNSPAREQPVRFLGTSWISELAFLRGHSNSWRHDATANAKELFDNDRRAISDARIEVRSESSLPLLAISQYVEITINGEAHK